MSHRSVNETETKNEWDATYAAGKTPFDLDEPLAWIVELFDRGDVRGSVLDAGCGAGHNAIWLAEKGLDVVGADLSPTAIARAKAKAEARGAKVDFFAGNLCELSGYDGRFGTVVDIGCFHSVHGPENRARYAAAIRRACAPGAVVHVRAFTDGNAFPQIDPKKAPRVSEVELRAAFALGFRVDALEERETVVIVRDPPVHLGVRAWFARVVAV